MSAYQLDTSGTVGGMSWADLDPFTQGCVEALFAGLELDVSFIGEWLALRAVTDPTGPLSPAFSDLAPETLARIVEDCARFQAFEPGGYVSETGSQAWGLRQSGAWPNAFPPLTPYLADDGKVYLRKASK